MTDSMNPPRNKILCGDCMDGLKDLPDGCVDLIMMDPPYHIDTADGKTGLGPRKHLEELEGGDVHGGYYQRRIR